MNSARLIQTNKVNLLIDSFQKLVHLFESHCLECIYALEQKQFVSTRVNNIR